MEQRICEFCKNKSRNYDFPTQGTVTCKCKSPKNIHNDCLPRKLDPLSKDTYQDVKDLICETCKSKILLNGTFYFCHKVNGLYSSEQNYKDSILEGIYKEYFYDGESLKKEMFYKNGKLEGLAKFWSRNPEEDIYLEAEENYTNGILEGLSIYYDSDGSIIEKILYNNGNVVESYYEEN